MIGRRQRLQTVINTNEAFLIFISCGDAYAPAIRMPIMAEAIVGLPVLARACPGFAGTFAHMCSQWRYTGSPPPNLPTAPRPPVMSLLKRETL